MQKFLIFIFLFKLISCGVSPETAEKEDSSYGPYAESSFGEPIELLFSDEECDDTRTTPSSIQYFLRGHWIQSEITSFEKPDLLEEVSLGGKFEKIIENNMYMLVENISPRKFNFCQPKVDYHKKTIQDAGLSIINVLNVFEKEFKVVLNNYNLSTVNINVLPQVYETDHNSLTKGYLVNNAFYTRFRKEITFLPQGKHLKSGFIPFLGTPLWKIPSVALHEYGHHIFDEIFLSENKSVDEDNYGDGHLCFDNSSARKIKSETNALKKRLITHSRVSFRILNEAFADLLGSFALNKDDSLRLTGCLERSRDVKSSKFFNKTEKRLTEDFLERIISVDKEKALPCFKGVNIQDEHLSGAIFANAFYGLLNSSSISRKDSLMLLLTWLESIKTLDFQSITVKDFLESIPENFFSFVSLKYDISKISCQKYFKKFPTVEYQCL